MDVFGDRSHRFAPPAWVMFDALTVDLHKWLDLASAEVRPRILEAERPNRVVWSSFWPVSPNDTVELPDSGSTRSSPGTSGNGSTRGREPFVNRHRPEIEVPLSPTDRADEGHFSAGPPSGVSSASWSGPDRGIVRGRRSVRK